MNTDVLSAAVSNATKQFGNATTQQLLARLHANKNATDMNTALSSYGILHLILLSRHQDNPLDNHSYSQLIAAITRNAAIRRAVVNNRRFGPNTTTTTTTSSSSSLPRDSRSFALVARLEKHVVRDRNGRPGGTCVPYPVTSALKSLMGKGSAGAVLLSRDLHKDAQKVRQLKYRQRLGDARQKSHEEQRRQARKEQSASATCHSSPPSSPPPPLALP